MHPTSTSDVVVPVPMIIHLQGDHQTQEDSSGGELADQDVAEKPTISHMTIEEAQHAELEQQTIVQHPTDLEHYFVRLPFPSSRTYLIPMNGFYLQGRD
jgi:hypothetical protein